MVTWAMWDWSYGTTLEFLFCIEVLGCLGLKLNMWFDILGWGLMQVEIRSGVLMGLRKIQTWN